MTGTAITGWGMALPERVVTNKDFENHLDTSDEWIVERTGIRERRMGGTTSSLAIEAGNAALKSAGLTGADVDLIILATTTPDMMVPATSSLVHDAIGARGGAFDLNAACAGFAYSLVTANALLSTGGHRRVLIIGSDTLTRITDQQDRSTAVLFGDGAGAIVLEAIGDESLIVAHDLGVDGSAVPLLYSEHGGYIQMDGREVFRRAVRAEVSSIKTVLSAAGVGPDEIALFVPHQANLRIIEAMNARLGIPIEKTSIVLDHTGNTSGASLPIALCEAAEAGRLHDGDLVLISGFGAGMTWASLVVRWGVTSRR
jgi:3-oxoacyl-[acyl-carrier-protein] synthase III